MVRNDQISAGELSGMHVDGVLVSPGPGYPKDAGNCIEIIRHCYEHGIPMLGVCLGHQALGEAFGAEIVPAPTLMHGKASLIEHEGLGVFTGAPSPLVGGRYHSLVVSPITLPDCFEVTARCDDIIMGMRHRDAPLEGIQFHPESVMTQNGYLLLANWLNACGSPGSLEISKELDRKSDALRAHLPGVVRAPSVVKHV